MFIKCFCSKILNVSFASKSAQVIQLQRSNCVTFSGIQSADLFNILEKSSLYSPTVFITRNMAGHAKWQNIKHIKAEKDRQKNLMCNKYVRLVSAAIRERGPDPKMNNKLATLLDEAKKNNVPSSTIEGAMKRGSNKKMKPGTIEILGPGGFFVVVEYETDNVGEMRHTLKVLCKKYNANILSGEGRWRAVYEQKGILKVISLLNGEEFNAETMLDSAIEAGAEDVQKREDENDKIFYEFISSAEDLHGVKKELEKNYIIEEAYIGYLPMSNVSLSEQDMDLANKLLDELGDLPDISRIFENIE